MRTNLLRGAIRCCCRISVNTSGAGSKGRSSLPGGEDPVKHEVTAAPPKAFTAVPSGSGIQEARVFSQQLRNPGSHSLGRFVAAS